MAKAERAEWLKARLGECLLDGELPDFGLEDGGRKREGKGTLVPSSGKRSESGSSRSSGSGGGSMKGRKPSNERRRSCLSATDRGGVGASTTTTTGLLDPADPLGLMRLSDRARVKGWIALKVVGVGGMLGALVWWAARTWNWSWEFGSGVDEGWVGWWER